MLRIVFFLGVLAALAASYEFGQHHPLSQAKSNRTALYYVDPMHPAYRSDKPGVAPDCGMQLEPVYADGVGKAPPLEPTPPLPGGAVRIDGATRRLMGIRLGSVERSGATRTIRVVGRVVPEDTRQYRVNSGVDGFVRETLNDSVGTQVRKDQKLASYYAPDFAAAASGFLAASERATGSVAKEGARSIQNYSDRLRNLGMSDVQIKHMTETRQLPESIDVVAPADGFILARNITPGQHFERNMEFYRVADLNKVWVVAEIYEREAPSLHPGGTAQVTLREGARRLSARITESLPQSETGGGTVKLRLEVDNPGFLLRPEMLVDVELPVHLPPAITVPVDALVDSGARTRVYVERGNGIFEPREVETGWRFGDRVEVLRGVKPGEQVVTAATFLVDSESKLKSPASAAANDMEKRTPVSAAASAAPSGATKDPNCGMPVDPAKSAAAGNSLAYKGATYYFCSSRCKQAFQSDPEGVSRKRQGGDDD
jgi:Cu(I)/Ag(I) efflux system membrane fusion protein